MRTGIAFVLLSSLCFLGTAAAQAQQQDRARAGQAAPTQGPRFAAARFIKDFDKNGDGKLSKDEAPENLREHFAAIDTNKDGQISPEELQQYADRMAQGRPRAVEMLYIVVDEHAEEAPTVQELQQAYDLLRKFDKNHDGKIDPKAVADYRQLRCKERFDTIIKDLDKNHDGKISKSEARGLLADDFDQLDTNKDGFIDRQELEKACMPARQNQARGAKPQGSR
jgi:Ca2+-binding EF-hand superfamily protein